MNKLFKKILTVYTIAFAMFGAFACSDKVAGTAEEPNQSANKPSEFDSVEKSSSSIILVPEGSISSSSKNRGEDGLPLIPISSESKTGFGGGTSSPDNPTNGGTVYITLDSYLKSYGITDVAFNENVLAYNKTFESCDPTKNTCLESPEIAELRTTGLHKIAPETIEILPYIFPKAYLAIKDTIKTNSCPLYVLNIRDTSPAIHVLTKISKDNITINDISDNCDYEPRPFEMHVGFLFSYCGELSEAPKIVTTFTVMETMNCSDVKYFECLRK